LNVTRATITRITSKVTHIGITMTYTRSGWWRLRIKAKETPPTTTAKASNSENKAIRRINVADFTTGGQTMRKPKQKTALRST
jgi:hypothetical protein